MRLLFEYVRDEVAYEMAPRFDEGRDEWKASATLERGYGFCQQKAVALAALLRARGIPAGIVVQDLLRTTRSRRTTSSSSARSASRCTG